jgi:hypothetical protein
MQAFLVELGVAMYAICAMVEKRMTRWTFRGGIVG